MAAKSEALCARAGEVVGEDENIFITLITQVLHRRIDGFIGIRLE